MAAVTELPKEAVEIWVGLWRAHVGRSLNVLVRERKYEACSGIYCNLSRGIHCGNGAVSRLVQSHPARRRGQGHCPFLCQIVVRIRCGCNHTWSTSEVWVGQSDDDGDGPHILRKSLSQTLATPSP